MLINQLPDKIAVHPQADALNGIEIRNGKSVLICGAKRKNGSPCRRLAGAGTTHKGYGRCLLHGGRSTGPITDEGKAVVAQNARRHGFYSDVLTQDEKPEYEAQKDEEITCLTHEIKMLRAKIKVYLRKWAALYAVGGEEVTRVAFRVVTDTEEGEKVSNIAGHYFAGSVDDRVLLKALNELRKLVEAQSRLDPDGNANVVDEINKELRAASHGKVTMEWGNRKAQERKQKD